MSTTPVARDTGVDAEVAAFHNSTIAGSLRAMARDSEFDNRPFARRLINEAADRLDRAGK
jgi:hypothetical protein